MMCVHPVRITRLRRGAWRAFVEVPSGLSVAVSPGVPWPLRSRALAVTYRCLSDRVAHCRIAEQASCCPRFCGMT